MRPGTTKSATSRRTEIGIGEIDRVGRAADVGEDHAGEPLAGALGDVVGADEALERRGDDPRTGAQHAVGAVEREVRQQDLGLGASDEVAGPGARRATRRRRRTIATTASASDSVVGRRDLQRGGRAPRPRARRARP